MPVAEISFQVAPPSTLVLILQCRGYSTPPSSPDMGLLSQYSIEARSLPSGRRSRSGDPMQIDRAGSGSSGVR